MVDIEIPNKGYCDICGKHRAHGNHAKCSKKRQKQHEEYWRKKKCLEKDISGM
jgi:hypothetical protein